MKYRVTYRLSSRARRAPQRENGVVVYLVDEKGQRFESSPNPAPKPFHVLLQHWAHYAGKYRRVQRFEPISAHYSKELPEISWLFNFSKAKGAEPF